MNKFEGGLGQKPPDAGLNPELRKELREKRARFLGLLQSARTYQELMWLAEAAAEETSRGPQILNDRDEPIPLKSLVLELMMHEYGERKEKALIFSSTNARQLRPLQRKIIEIDSTRTVLNTMYEQETEERMAPGVDEFFTVRTINREKFDREAAPRIAPPEDPTPILVVPGYTVGHEALRRTAIGIAELDRSVATFAVPPTNKAFDAGLHFPDRTSTATKVHATALLKAMDACSEKKFENNAKFDVLAYSYGAINALTAAMAQPEKFRKILLVNPAGLTDLGDPYIQRFLKLSRNSFRHHKQVLGEAGREPLPLRQRISPSRRYNEFIANLVADPTEEFDRSRVFYDEFSKEMNEIGKEGGYTAGLRVADAISRANLIPMIQHLTKLGIQVAILPAENDPFFPVEQIEDAGKEAGVNVFPAAGAHANVGFMPGAMTALYIDVFNDMGPHHDEKQGA